MGRGLRNSLVGRAGDRPAKLAFRVINTKWIKQRLDRRYGRAVRAHVTALPELSLTDRTILDGLIERGFYVTSLAELGLQGSAGMFEQAVRVFDGCAATARAQALAGREFTCVAPETCAQHPEIFRWGLNDRLLDIAEAYIGLPVAYDGMTMIYTVADSREVATRQWHRDREDRKMLKVAVYCNDVGDGGGAFQIIPRLDPSQGGDAGYRYAGGSEEELSALLGADYRRDIVTCEGLAGTVIFADTARYFHRGEPVHTRDRQAIFYSYFARQTRHPFFCSRSGLDERQLADMVRGMSVRQQASVLWRKALPLLAKLVPPAPV